MDEFAEFVDLQISRAFQLTSSQIDELTSAAVQHGGSCRRSHNEDLNPADNAATYGNQMDSFWHHCDRLQKHVGLQAELRQR